MSYFFLGAESGLWLFQHITRFIEWFTKTHLLLYFWSFMRDFHVCCLTALSVCDRFRMFLINPSVSHLSIPKHLFFLLNPRLLRFMLAESINRVILIVKHTFSYLQYQHRQLLHLLVQTLVCANHRAILFLGHLCFSYLGQLSMVNFVF